MVNFVGCNLGSKVHVFFPARNFPTQIFEVLLTVISFCSLRMYFIDNLGKIEIRSHVSLLPRIMAIEMETITHAICS